MAMQGKPKLRADDAPSPEQWKKATSACSSAFMSGVAAIGWLVGLRTIFTMGLIVPLGVLLMLLGAVVAVAAGIIGLVSLQKLRARGAARGLQAPRGSAKQALAPFAAAGGILMGLFAIAFFVAAKLGLVGPP